MIKWLRNQFATPKPPPDLPGAIVPGWVIDSFPLLSRMPQLIGLDLRYVTQDKFMPQEIPFLKAFDGMKYNGVAVVHEKYAIVAESGKSMVRGLPFWYLGVIAMDTNLEYIVQLSDRLLQVYNSLPANKVTSLHLELAMCKENTILSTWTEAKFLPAEGSHMKCRLSFHSLNQTHNVVLRYEIGGDVL
jgi:hypothetical protein